MFEAYHIQYMYESHTCMFHVEKNMYVGVQSLAAFIIQTADSKMITMLFTDPYVLIPLLFLSFGALPSLAQQVNTDP